MTTANAETANIARGQGAESGLAKQQENGDISAMTRLKKAVTYTITNLSEEEINVLYIALNTLIINYRSSQDIQDVRRVDVAKILKHTIED